MLTHVGVILWESQSQPSFPAPHGLKVWLYVGVALHPLGQSALRLRGADRDWFGPWAKTVRTRGLHLREVGFWPQCPKHPSQTELCNMSFADEQRAEETSLSHFSTPTPFPIRCRSRVQACLYLSAAAFRAYFRDVELMQESLVSPLVRNTCKPESEALSVASCEVVLRAGRFKLLTQTLIPKAPKPVEEQEDPTIPSHHWVPDHPQAHTFLPCAECQVLVLFTGPTYKGCV